MPEKGIPLDKLAAFMEFIDDSNHLKILSKTQGGSVTYYTSALAPKIFSKDELTVIECDAGSVVACKGV